MLENDEDRLALVRDLGESVNVNGQSVFGIFDNDYTSALEFPGVQSSEPELTCRSSDVVSVVEGDVVDFPDGRVFIVRLLEPDGTGMTLLRLQDG